MMIGDLEQPARYWLADLITNLNMMLVKGEDPSMLIKVNQTEFEFRLMQAGDVYLRTGHHSDDNTTA